MKKNLFTLLLITCSVSGFAQNYSGYKTENNIGVNGAFFNPANIADSRYRFDVNLASIGVTAINDYATVNTKNFFKVFSNESLDSIITRRGVANAGFLLDADVFGPSVMFNIDAKNSLAVTTRARGMVNIDKIPNDLLNTLENNGDNITFPDTLTSNKFGVTYNTWAELGVTFGRVLSDNGANFFKGGITVKYLAGLGAGYLSLSNLDANINKDLLGNSYLQNSTGQLSYGASGLGSEDHYKVHLAGSGIGADIGFVYEYRPDHLIKNSKKYKFKVDLALHDLGGISYTHSSYDGAYALNTNLNPNPPIIHSDTLQLKRFSGVSNFTDLTNAITAANPMLTKTTAASNKYMMSLPTSLTGSVDYNFISNFYANLGGMLSLNSGGSKIEKTHTVNYLSLTPRYEIKKFAVALPLTVNDIDGFTAGLSFRAGPFFAGSGSILSTLFSGKTEQADFHFGLHVGIMKKNKKQKAVKESTTKVTSTAKVIDTDGDGIADADDKCPTVPGLAKYNGCPIPDTDGDGINDEEDKCPTVPGVAKYNGCPIPDTDKDGINDEEDKCPTVPGVAKYHGCPIPDSDSDGINDEEDKCPTVPGVARYNGCPIPDTDKDGVNDEEDRCPTVPGPASNHGCPVIKKELIQKINFAAKSLLFQTGKAVILKKSYLQLDNVVRILKADSSFNLEIDGYTDNSGDSIKNVKLSTDRANAAKAYLIKKGVAAKRLNAQGFGPTKPIAPNKTPQGRAKNRRVEFTLKNY